MTNRSGANRPQGSYYSILGMVLVTGISSVFGKILFS